MIWVLIKVQENIWIYRMEGVSQAREIPGADSCHPVPCRPCPESSGLLWSGRECEVGSWTKRGQMVKTSVRWGSSEWVCAREGYLEMVSSCPGRTRASAVFSHPSPLRLPQGQLPKVSLNPYVGFGYSCFWLCSAARDLQGGGVICTAVIRVIARYFPKFLLEL